MNKLKDIGIAQSPHLHFVWRGLNNRTSNVCISQFYSEFIHTFYAELLDNTNRTDETTHCIQIVNYYTIIIQIYTCS